MKTCNYLVFILHKGTNFSKVSTFTPMPKKFTFTKAERLKSRKVIKGLFAGGESFGAYPVRVVWREMEERKSEAPAQVTFSVPRLGKHKVYRKREESEKQLAIMLIYTGKEELPYADIEKSMGKIIWRLGKINDENWKSKRKS